MFIVVLLWLVTCLIASLIGLASSIIGGSRLGYYSPIPEPLSSTYKSAMLYTLVPIVNIWKTVKLLNEVLKY